MHSLKKLRSLGRIRARRIFTGDFHSENHDEFLSFLNRAIRASHPATNLSLEIRGGLVHLLEGEVDTGCFWHLPKLKKEQVGILEFRSKDYRFLGADEENYSYGPALTADDLRDFGFEVDAGSGSLQYHIEDLAG